MAPSTRTRVKTPALAVVAPATAAQAAAMVARMGSVGRDLVLLTAALDEEIAARRASVEVQAAPLRVELANLQAGVQAWAEANRDDLTKRGRTKTVRLTTGALLWRRLPPSVRITTPGAVLLLLETMGLERFLRRNVTINRQAMRGDPVAARLVPGVSIGNPGEEFIVQPHAEELVG
ncbi:host-nuclease inhibitor Gam family protein [Humitalea sp. 24SJ18S-53]|uniref:host-nuclease inhibitor Gam family protein n=1 Tax=Humitalea sp. 24SJ18S-53 TaxID=3422307 RepID=UPI003D6785DD